MVHVSDAGSLSQEPDVSVEGKKAAATLPVKLEIEDHNEEEFGPLAKRSRPSGSLQQVVKQFQQQWRADASTIPSQHGHHNPLNEPSPLGLRLRKSPSLLELIQMRLSQANAATPCISESEHRESGKKTSAKSAGASGTTDKLKASNFPASILRIGSWEVSNYPSV